MATQFRSREAQLFLDGLAEPEALQQKTLLETIIKPNVDSEFGREHGFDRIRSVADYQHALPVANYDSFAPYIDRVVESGEQGLLTTGPVKRFFMTSGSTAKAKYIPVTNTLIRAKSRAFGVYWAAVFEQHPRAKAGRMVTNFSDSGEPDQTPGGLPCGSESSYWAGVTRATQLETKPIIPKLVARVKGSDARYYAIARILLEAEFSVIMTLNPSTILLLFQKIVQYADTLAADIEAGTLSDRFPFDDEVRAYVREHLTGNPRRADELRALVAENALLAHRVWPELALGISWRSPMLRPYIELLAPHFGHVPQRDYIMMASEGVMAIPIQDGTSGGPVAVGVHFYEFIPEAEAESPNPSVLLPHELEVGQRYVVVLTNGAGLYRYNIGDVVRVTGFVGRTPSVEFLHRAGRTSSLTGEKLTEDQVTAAVGDVVAALGLELESFTLCPAKQGFPHYLALVEFKTPPSEEAKRAFPRQLDRALEDHNVEYGSKRSSQRLALPELWVVERGQFEAQRRKRLATGTSDSQIKPTHLTRDPDHSDGFVIVEKIHADS